ncbi:unnamed protein product [Rangifer tarandus platyrhynchus]|uniref:Uncharacterized protein n=1 Tax=Rangifer tarandus platyrhynchus TaxID=3082113 RepID=A0AC59ZPV3_RANTA
MAALRPRPARPPLSPTYRATGRSPQPALPAKGPPPSRAPDLDSHWPALARAARGRSGAPPPPPPRTPEEWTRGQGRDLRYDAGALPTEGVGWGLRRARKKEAGGRGKALKGPRARGLGRAQLRVRARVFGVGAGSVASPRLRVARWAHFSTARGTLLPGASQRAPRTGAWADAPAVPEGWCPRWQRPPRSVGSAGSPAPGTLPGSSGSRPLAARPRGGETGAGLGVGPPEAAAGTPPGLTAPRARTPAVAGPLGGSPGSRRPHGPASGSLGVCGGPGRIEGADGAAGLPARAPLQAAVLDAPGSSIGTENRTPIGPCGQGRRRVDQSSPGLGTGDLVDQAAQEVHRLHQARMTSAASEPSLATVTEAVPIKRNLPKGSGHS